MRIVDAEYEMLSDRRQLQQEAYRLRAQLWDMHGKLSRAELEAKHAQLRAQAYGCLVVALTIALGGFVAWHAGLWLRAVANGGM